MASLQWNEVRAQHWSQKKSQCCSTFSQDASSVLVIISLAVQKTVRSWVCGYYNLGKTDGHKKVKNWNIVLTQIYLYFASAHKHGNHRIRSVKWARTWGSTLFAVRPFEYSCEFRLTDTSQSIPPHDFLGSAASKLINSVILQQWVDADAQAPSQVTGCSVRPNRYITVPTITAYQLVTSSRLITFPSAMALWSTLLKTVT